MKTQEEYAAEAYAEAIAFCKGHGLPLQTFLRHPSLRASHHLINKLRRGESVSTRSLGRMGEAMLDIDPNWTWP